MPKLQKRKDSFFLTLSKELVKAMDWRAGDTILQSRIDDSSVKLEKQN